MNFIRKNVKRSNKNLLKSKLKLKKKKNKM